MTDNIALVLPTGEVTFLFTDIEGSTRLVQELGDAYRDLLDAHQTIMRSALTINRGIEVGTEGDSFFAVFTSSHEAVKAAADAQAALAAASWPDGADVKVRMGLHTGMAKLGGSDYIGLDVNRAARITAAAHGGQTVLSEATAVLVERALPPGISLRDLGKHRLKDLLDPEAIFQLVIAGLPNDFPPLRTLDAVSNNLPLQVTSFVGREGELAKAIRLLEGTRVLTLTGPGGTGKTRLALQLAADVSEAYRDGVHFVELSPIVDPEFVPSTILNALGLQTSAGDSPAEWLLAQLRNRSLLMVLDNFEQLLEAAPLVSEMVQAARDSKFVVTSRAPLHIRGEQEMPVPPLRVADPARRSNVDALMRVEAIRLFMERAVAAAPDFALTEQNAGAVAALVSRLDGLPLAIELVASRTKLLPVKTILERLELHSLSSTARDLPRRQQTVWNAIDWSYDLLDEPCRRLFGRLSVFVGGAGLEEIERVCGPGSALGADVFDALATLVDHSLVARIEGPEEPRFRMLHVLWEYARERLGEDPSAETIRQSHAQTYADLVEALAPQLFGGSRKETLDTIERDRENVWAALRWAIDHRDTNLAMRITWAAWRFWQARGYLHEAKRYATEVHAMPGGDPYRRAKALEACGGIAWWKGEMDVCTDMYREALDIQRELGDESEIANALYNLALAIGFSEGSKEKAEAMLDEAERLCTALGDTGGLGNVNWGRGSLAAALEPGGSEAAREYFGRSIDQYRQADNEFGLGWALYEYGQASRRLGDFDTARDRLSQGLELLYGHGDLSAVVLFVASLAGLAKELGDMDRAVRMAGAAQRLRETTGADIVTHESNQTPGLELETLEALTGDLALAYREGRTMDLDHSVRYAIGRTGLEEAREPRLE